MHTGTVTTMGNYLTSNDSLKKLNISGNKISNEETIRLAEALKVNKTLELLNISCNHADIL